MEIRNPFVGLRPFQSTEEEIFFGRSKEISVLRDLTLTLPVLIVYAPSGTGKSSLINAGLIPALRQVPGMIGVTVADPRQEPAEAVLAALAAPGVHHWTPGAEGESLSLAELLEKHYEETDNRVILVLDQFEERIKQSRSIETLFGEIAKLANTRSEAATVVISIRDDYIAGLEQLMRRVSGLLDAGYRVPPLSRNALTEAVIRPLSLVNAEIGVEPGLIDLVLTDLEQHSAAEAMGRRIEPGYFQIVWSRLWTVDVHGTGDTLTIQSYQAEGGVNEILRSFVTRILGKLLPYEAAVLYASLRYLVLPTGAKVALTIEDLMGLVRSEDAGSFGFEGLLFIPDDPNESLYFRRYVPSHPHPELPRVFESVFEQLTRSDAPLFRRVERGQRKEFELMHDLLGIILNEWRANYIGAQRAASRRDISSEPRKPPALSDAMETVRKALNHADSGQWSALASEPISGDLETVFNFLGASEWFSKVNRYKELLNLISSLEEKLRPEAFLNQDRAVRGRIQWYVWRLGGINRGMTGPSGGITLPKILAAATIALAASSGVYLTLLISGLLPFLPSISYQPLTLSVAAIGSLGLYFGGYVEALGPVYAKVIAALWPVPDASSMSRIQRILRWSCVLIWWPIIWGTFTALCYIGAVIFEAAGWSPTAGFNLAAIGSVVAVVTSYAISIDF